MFPGWNGLRALGVWIVGHVANLVGIGTSDHPHNARPIEDGIENNEDEGERLLLQRYRRGSPSLYDIRYVNGLGI